ncbi:putative pentatricopeptide repeat-containing protein [Tanacetum coccineum]
MMMNRTKSAVVDALLKLRFKGICISSRSFSETGLASPKKKCFGGAVFDRRETLYPKKKNVINPSFLKFYGKFLCLEMLEKMTREDPLPCVDDFTHILEVVTPMLVNHDVYYRQTCFSFIASFLVGLVFEDRNHEAYMFLNKLIKHKVCQPATLMYNTVIIALCDNSTKTMMDDALKLYQEMVSQPDVVTYNSLVSGLCKIRRWTKAYFLLKEMLDIDIVSPRVETFNILINTICIEGRLQVAAHVIYMMHERGISPNIATYNSLIDAHCVKGEMDKARSLVNYMVSNHHLAPDTATYTSLLNGYCNDYDKMEEANDYCKDENKMDDAMLIYHEMNEKGFKPNCVTYNRMIQSCFSADHFGDAHKLLDDVLAQGQTLDTCTYRDILQDLLEKQHVAETFSLIDLLGEDSKLNSDMSVLEVLLDGLFDCGELDFARELFEGLSARGIKPTPDIYNSMIFGFCEKGLINDAKRLFLEMEENHCWPTTDTYNYLLRVYLENKCYDDVKVLLYKMKRQKHYLYKSTLPMLRASVAAGSLDATLSNLIKNLV